MRLIFLLFLCVLASACSTTSKGSTVLDNQGIIRPAVSGSDVYTLGQDIYNTQCAACHGFDGEGQFPDAPLKPDATGRFGAPPHNGTGHTWHHSDAQLIQIIREGGMGDPAAFYPMPAFGNQLSDAEIQAVLAYIKTMWSEDQQAVQRERSLNS